MNKERFELVLAQFPLSQYAWITTDELVFTDRVRTICETECPMYAKSWACPPAVGSVEACRKTCLSYPEALVLTTLAEVSDIADITQTLQTRKPHESITHQIDKLMRAECADVMVLSTEACTLCETCTYPDAPCRHLGKIYPCVESHGILATDIAEKHGIEFYSGNLVTWFSILFFRDK